jgi:hypothetical protein
MATKKKTSKKASKKTPRSKANGKGEASTAKQKKDDARIAKTKKARDAKAATDRNEAGKARIAKAKKAVERSRSYAASGLAAQVTETLIDEIRALDKPWHQTSESQQAVVIARLSDRVANAMALAVQVMAASGHKAVICNLFSVTFKDGVKATITVAPSNEKRHDLADYATKDAVLVLADPSVFMQGLADVKADADQPRLI